jgi:2,6-dihydroxypyridine 3-monooxygenase
VVVAGGSLGGLTAALWLAEAGCEVTVCERSRLPLEGRGAGIVLHPSTVRYWVEHGSTDLSSIAAAVRQVRYLTPAGDVASEVRCRFWFASYTSLYQGLLSCLDRGRYLLGREVVGCDRDGDEVVVRCGDGTEVRADLLVWADGIQSTGRRILLPGAAFRYAGYVGWRGTVRESDLRPPVFASLAGAITYYLLHPGHILAYPILYGDGGGRGPERRINWVWYVNVPGDSVDDLMTDRDGVRQTVSVPPGGVREEHVRALRRYAREVLPPPLREMVLRTSHPFLQRIGDLSVPRMAFDRMCLVGDAAFVARPHVAAGTAKAAEDAWRLARAVASCEGDIAASLRVWEPPQLSLGASVVERAREVGERMQVTGAWPVGAPLPFGLYQNGDSEFEGPIAPGHTTPSDLPDGSPREPVPRPSPGP